MKKLFILLFLLGSSNCVFSQSEYPQVTKIKQKCYEIYNKLEQPSQNAKDLVYKKIDYICDSIVNASTLDYPYIDLQLVSKKQIVEVAQRMVERDLVKQKEVAELAEKKRIEEEARAKIEAERIAAEKAKKAERIAAEKHKKELILASLPAAKEKVLFSAKKYEDMFPVEAYQICNDIFKMYLEGSLRHIKTKTANGVEYMGWVDLSGIPCGIAQISKPVRPGVESVYTGIFYKGKPIFGQLKLWSPESGEKYTRNSFTDLQNITYNSKPTYVLYNENGEYLVRFDGNGNPDGVFVGPSDYRILKGSNEIADIGSNEITIKKLYNYFLQQHPQTATKIVENFPLSTDRTYTGGWKDGEPDGVGVIKTNPWQYLCLNASNGIIINSMWLYPTKAQCRIYNNNNEIYSDYTCSRYSINGVLVPHNNNGVGMWVYHDHQRFELATMRLKEGISIDPANPSEEILFDYLNSSVIKTDIGYAYFRNYDIDGKPTDFAGIGAKGTFTIEHFDTTSMQHIIKILGNSGQYFEGYKLSDNSYIGVLYGQGNYIYIGYVDDDLKYKGEGYLLDATDGTIMRQGIWNSENMNLQESRKVKDFIDGIYPTIISEVLAKNKEVLNKNSIKLAPSVRFEFPSFQQ